MLSARSCRSIRRFTSATQLRAFGLPLLSFKKKNEIVEKQNDYEVDQNAKIVILDEKNAASYKPFDPETDIPGFRINQWKSTVVRAQDVEASVTKEMVNEAINKAYASVMSAQVSAEEYSSSRLDDLTRRFEFFKLLQLELGFDIKDHTISRSHTLEYVRDALHKQIASRWSSERNPNAIVLRPEDFAKQENVYLNNELNEEEQAKLYEELKEKASAI